MTIGRKWICLRLSCGFPNLCFTVYFGVLEVHFLLKSFKIFLFKSFFWSWEQILNPKVPLVPPHPHQVLFVCFRNYSFCPVLSVPSTFTPPQTHFERSVGHLAVPLLSCWLTFPCRPTYCRYRPLTSCLKRTKSLCDFSPSDQREADSVFIGLLGQPCTVLQEKLHQNLLVIL